MTEEGSVPVKADQIQLKVKGPDHEVMFKIRRNTPMRKLMQSYCERQGKSFESVRFLYEGNRIHETDTPESLEMEDDDEIQALVQQLGGYLLA